MIARPIERLLLLVLFTATFVVGCFDEASAPAPHRTTLAQNGGGLPKAAGCSVTEADIAAVKFGDFPEDTISQAHDVFWKAREANNAVEKRLAENLARVGPALTPPKVAAFVDAFERMGTVDGKSVAEVRASYATATRGLAAVLDAVDANEDIAYSASGGKLIAAYAALAESPCPARAVRFAAILLALPETPQSPYIPLERQEGTSHGVSLLYTALAGGVVEEGIAAGDPDAGLARVREWVGFASGTTGSLASILVNREALRAQLTPNTPAITIKEVDFTQPLSVVNGVLAIWNLNDAVREGDVLAILQSGPGGIEAISKAVSAIGKHFEWARVAQAEKVAKVAAQVGRCVSAVFEAKAIVELLIALSDPSTDKDATIVALGGHVLVLVGAFVPPPLGIALSFAGSIAIVVSRFLQDPPPDELSPLLQALVDLGMLTTTEKEALSKARAQNMFILKAKLALGEDDVLFTVTRAPEAMQKGDGIEYIQVLAKAAAEKGKSGSQLIHAIAKSSDVAWARFELETFFLHVKPQPLTLFKDDHPQAIRRDLLIIRNERFVTGFFDPKYSPKRDDGSVLGTEAQLLSHARMAIDGALASIP